MTNQSREFYPSMLPVKSGTPMIKSSPSLGWQLVKVRARCWVEGGMPEAVRKEVLRQNTNAFIAEQESLGKQYVSKYGVQLSGPFPHFEPRTGGAHSIGDHVGEDDREDYYVEACFRVREHVELLDNDVAEKVMGTRGIRPYRAKEWHDN